MFLCLLLNGYHYGQVYLYFDFKIYFINLLSYFLCLKGEVINRIISFNYVHVISIITTIISYTNSFSNPLLYIFFSKKFSIAQSLRSLNFTENREFFTV